MLTNPFSYMANELDDLMHGGALYVHQCIYGALDGMMELCRGDLSATFSLVTVGMITAIFLLQPIGMMRIGIEFAVMLVHQMFLFIRTVHFSEILGTFDKTASKKNKAVRKCLAHKFLQ